MGNEVVRLIVGSRACPQVDVLAREPMTAGLRGVHMRVMPGDDPAGWTRVEAKAAIVMFEPPRLFYQRERALWTPQPGQLPALAAWLRDCGVTTLAVVMPHVQMRLPEALKRGLAGLDEHAVAQLRFERLLFVRSAQKPGAENGGHPLTRLARLMMSIGQYMVPGSEQPVRAVKVARFVVDAIELAPPGIHVAAPETVWHAAQGDVRAAVAQWLAA
jgi:hypothetical protein